MSPMSCQLIAQLTPHDPAAWSGWSAVGVLVLVLSWLMFRYLPAKDQQSEDAQRRSDDLIREVVDRHTAEQREQRDAFTQALDRLASHCEGELLAITEAHQRQTDRILAKIEETRGG